MTKTLYIDQSRFIQLLEAQTGSSRARPGAADALEALRASVAAGTLVIPLSVAHYHETWHVHDWRRRHSLAALMRELSGYVVLAPIQVVTRLELEALVSGVRDYAVIGQGANFAFDSPTGRLTIVDEGFQGLYPKRSTEEPPDILEAIQATSAEAWEWFNLAGLPEDFPLRMPRGMEFEFRPEHPRGDDWVAEEESLRERVVQFGLWGRLREILVAEDTKAMLEELNSVAAEYGIDPHVLLGPPPDGLLEFHARLPSRSTIVDLTYYRLKERQYRPAQHDRLDLLAHAVAFPYCDIVLTERRLADLARKACISDRFGTTVIHRLAELSALL